MGFFNKLFGNAEENSNEIEVEKNTIYAPLKGNVIPLKEIGDGVFSEGILGKGCGIRPEAETVVAPFNGTITQITDTKHAIGVKSDDGIEMIIHVGLDTVSMNGKGFQVFVNVGDHISCGQKLLTFDSKAIADAGFSSVTAVIVINSDEYKDVEVVKDGQTEETEKLMVCCL